MKANEMTHEQLADEMDSLDVDPARWEWKDGSHNEYYNRLNEAFEEATERLRTLTALEAKIKGMIERPTILAIHNFACNELGEPCDTGSLIQVCTMLEEALGMEGEE